jgi:tRNA threonylcarbamoyladenosine biosynthesis protein TsaB
MEHAKRILAIETSGRYGSVATLWGDADNARLVGQTVLTGDQRTAQSLAPALQRLLAAADWAPKSVELVAVTVGPGSFTGLRIGVTTAKAFAYAVGADVVGINSLTTLAAQAPPSASPLWTILDAQRQEVFAAKFLVSENLDIRMERDTAVISQEHWLAGLTSGDTGVGPVLKRLVPRLPKGVVALPEELWQPMAAVVGQVAWNAYQAGQRDDVWKLAPTYYRPSAAEEKRMS